MTVSRQADPCCLYELRVSEETYAQLRRRLSGMYRQREEYHYNLLGALSCALNLPLVRRRHYFCSQFVAGLLEDSGAARLPKPPALLRPADFQGVRGLRPVHRGLLAGLLAQPAA